MPYDEQGAIGGIRHVETWIRTGFTEECLHVRRTTIRAQQKNRRCTHIHVPKFLRDQTSGTKDKIFRIIMEASGSSSNEKLSTPKTKRQRE